VDGLYVMLWSMLLRLTTDSQTIIGTLKKAHRRTQIYTEFYNQKHNKNYFIIGGEAYGIITNSYSKV
jgi:hypothetical protein